MSDPRPHYRWELLALLFLVFFFHQADRAIFGVVLGSIKRDLALGDAQLGLVATVLFATLALMMPIAGYLGDVWNRKRIIIGSLVFWSAATMCTGMAGGLAALIAFRSVATAGGEAFYTPAAYPLLAAHHTRTRAFALSIHQASLYIGVMVSGILGGYVADRWGWRSTFYLFGGGGILLGLILVWRLADAPAPAARAARPPVATTLAVVLRNPSALLLTAGFTAMVFVNNAYVVWAPVFLQERFGLNQAQAGGHAMTYHHVAALIGVVIGGRLSDQVALRHATGRPRMMAAAMLLAAPFIFLMGRAPGLAVTGAAMAGFGLFRGLYEANVHAALFEVIPPRFRGSAVGTTVLMAFVVGSMSPWLMGRLRETYPAGVGLGHGFSALSGAYVAGGLAVAAAALFTFRRDRLRGEAA